MPGHQNSIKNVSFLHLFQIVNIRNNNSGIPMTPYYPEIVKDAAAPLLYNETFIFYAA